MASIISNGFLSGGGSNPAIPAGGIGGQGSITLSAGAGGQINIAGAPPLHQVVREFAEKNMGKRVLIKYLLDIRYGVIIPNSVYQDIFVKVLVDTPISGGYTTREVYFSIKDLTVLDDAPVVMKDNRFPHTCQRCKAPSYNGIHVECSKKCCRETS